MDDPISEPLRDRNGCLTYKGIITKEDRRFDKTTGMTHHVYTRDATGSNIVTRHYINGTLIQFEQDTNQGGPSYYNPKGLYTDPYERHI